MRRILAEDPLLRRTREPRGKLPTRLFVLTLTLGLTQCSDLPVQPTAAEKEPPTAPQLLLHSGGLLCTDDGATLSSGALYRVCVDPGKWNRDMVVFIPGYHDPASDPSLPDDLSDTPAFLLFTRLGYAFATTSFRDTGLLEPDAWIAGDLLELVATAKALLYEETEKTTRYVYQTGGSQGGLGTLLAVEQYPSIFHGGLAACGPIGDYRRQIDYIADFRIVFDYFFKGVVKDPTDPGWTYPVWEQNLPDDPGYVDPDAWEQVKANGELAMTKPANARRLDQVLSVTGAPFDPNQPESKKWTAAGILWYSFRGTNDAIEKLNGMSFDNEGRMYTGSVNDTRLNKGVERFRFTADPNRLAKLQTSARPSRPLVTMHTTDDPIVPSWHQDLYRSRLSSLRRWLHTPFTIERYGHCNFKDEEVLAAFSVLVLKVTGYNMFLSSSALPHPQSRDAFLELAKQHGAQPQISAEPRTD
jgi:hypothetical protein